MKYVKICPVCGFKNPEEESVCQGEGCNEFVAQLEPVQDTVEVEPEKEQPSISVDGVPTLPSDFKSSNNENQKENPIAPHTRIPSDIIVEKRTPAIGHSKTQRFTLQPVLSIEYSGNEYEITSGVVLGKDHPESTATLKIPGMPDYIHRNHCKFIYKDAQWTVTAIQNPEFTNPTYVNATKVGPNQVQPLNNGDRLTLCDITFHVRIL